MRATTCSLVTAAELTLGASPASAIAPSNDSFAEAMSVRIAREYSGPLTEATPELGEPRVMNRGPFHSVWFRFRAAHAAPMTIDTGGSNFDTTLAAYTGNAVSGLSLVASDDDGSPSGTAGSTVRFVAHRGRTYSFSIDGYFESFDTVPDPTYKHWVSDGSIAGKGITVAVQPGQTVTSVRSGGLRSIVTARRKARIRVALLVTPREARRLGLRGRVLGSVSGLVDYNDQLPAVVRPTPAAARALRTQSTLNGLLRVTILGSRAPHRVSNQRVRLSG